MPSSNATTNLSGNVSTDVNNPTVITIPGNPKMVFLTLYGTGLVAYGRNGETVAVPPAPKSTASAANSCPDLDHRHVLERRIHREPNVVIAAPSAPPSDPASAALVADATSRPRTV